MRSMTVVGRWLTGVSNPVDGTTGNQLVRIDRSVMRPIPFRYLFWTASCFIWSVVVSAEAVNCALPRDARGCWDPGTKTGTRA